MQTQQNQTELKSLKRVDSIVEKFLKILSLEWTEFVSYLSRIESTSPKTAKNLIHELETYRYPDKKPDQNEPEKPVKENDHALDALRYALYMTEPVSEPIRDPYFEQVGTYYKDF